MRGLQESGKQQVAQRLPHDVPDVLCTAGGLGKADQGASGRDADGHLQSSWRTVTPERAGLHQGVLFEEQKNSARESDLSEAIIFIVPGTPVGKGRPKFARRGNFVTTYTPEKTASYENLVKVKAEEAMQGLPIIECAVAVVISLYVTPPASWSQKKQRAALAGEVFPTSKPDVDNVIKGIFDAMNEIVWKDDKQVVDVLIRKRYAHTARAHVEVRAI